MKNILLTTLALVIAVFSNATTEKYRLMFNGNPSTEITIAWNQVSGSGQTVHWGTTDHGTNYASYANSTAPYRSTNYLGMNNQFVVLSGLTPNTVYYFVIHDSDGTSDRYWFQTCPDVNTEKLSFISGGDSRSGTTQRQNSNRMVAKIRPHAVLFGGDLVNTPGNASMQQWMDDWQLATTPDGQMIPMVHSFGNHEQYGSGGAALINDLFDTDYDVYYNTRFGGDLFSMYTLNGELLPGHTIANGTKRTAQKNWLISTLSTDNSIWKGAQYHRPIVPHYSGKGEGSDEYEDWVNAFYDYGVRIVMESDAHIVKMTEEVKPVYTGTPSGSSSNWFTTTGIDPDKGITFVGEGSWGTIRTPDDSHPMTTAMGSFYSFNWITVDQCRIEIRTIDTQNPNAVAQHAFGDFFSVDAGLDAQTWKPSGLPTGVREIVRCNAPVADFTANQTTIFSGQTVNFTDLSTNTPTSWAWDFGDGGNSTQQNPSYQFNTPGVYTVELQATNADGTGVETKTNYITVVAPTAPTAEFTASTTSESVGIPINFTDLSTGNPASWSWDFGDGSGTSTQQNPSYAYGASGTYSVTLTVTNAYGNDTEVKTDYITIVNTATVDIPIADGNDDVEEANATGVLYFTSSDLEFCYDGSTSNASQHVGLRFQNVPVPQGAVISNAYITFRADEADNTQTVLWIAAHDVDNSGVWSGNYDVSGRTKTTSQYGWVHDGSTAWTVGNMYQTPDIRALVQEVISRPGWAANNAMSFMFWDDESTTNERVGDSYEGGFVAELHIEYSVGGTPPLDYCPSFYMGNDNEYISNVTFNTINNTSGDVMEAYSDFTNMSTDVAQNSTHQLDVTINTGGNETYHCEAFFDWNQDGDFNDASESYDLGDVTNVTAGVLSTSVTVPAGATLGNTRMRINIEQNGNPGPCNSDHNDVSGDTEDYTVNITNAVLQPPVAAFATSGTTICTGESIMFTDNSTNTPTSWDWDFGDGGTSTQQNPTYQFNTAGTFTVTFTATNGDGSDTETATITVNATPNVAATGTTTICEGHSTSINATGATTYSWDNGVGSGASHTVSPTTTTTYEVTGTTSGCSATDQVTITVNPVPTVTASGTATICEGQSTTIDGGGAGSYTWDNGVGAGQSHSVSPTTTTTYTVTGTTNGCSNTAVVTITVNPVPNVAATGSTTLCEGQSASINATGATTYSWDNGVGSGASHTVTPSTTTTYEVTGTTNGCSATDQVTITVNPVPNVAATGTTTICEGSSTSIDASGATTYSWDNGVGSGASHTVSPTTTTTYTVTGTSTGCTNTASVTITVNPVPNVAATGDATICEGSSTPIAATGATTYNWDNGVGAGASHTVSPTTTTTYTVTGTTSGCSNTATITVNVDTQSEPGTANPVTACVADNSVNLFDAIVGEDAGGSWADDDATGALSGSTLDATGLTVANTYNFTYSFAANGACAAVDVTTQVTITDVVDAGTPTAMNTACENNATFDLFNSLSGYTSGGTWADDDATGALSGSVFDATSVSAGTYDFTYTVTSGACGTDAETVSITVNSNPTLTVSSDDAICEGESITITASGATSFDWDNGLGAGASHTVSPTATTTYTATGDENGCTATASVTITVNALPIVSMDPFVSDSVCLDDAVFTLPQGNPTGGVYSGTGVSGSDFDPNVAGAGTHQVTYEYTDGNGCVNTANQTVVVIDCNLSLTENGVNTYKIYPNPTNGIVKIEFVNTNKSRITIYDMNGKVVLDQTSTDNPIVLDMSSWERGTYNVKIVNTDTKETKIDQIILK